MMAIISEADKDKAANNVMNLGRIVSNDHDGLISSYNDAIKYRNAMADYTSYLSEFNHHVYENKKIIHTKNSGFKPLKDQLDVICSKWYDLALSGKHAEQFVTGNEDARNNGFENNREIINEQAVLTAFVMVANDYINSKKENNNFSNENFNYLFFKHLEQNDSISEYFIDSTFSAAVGSGILDVWLNMANNIAGVIVYGNVQDLFSKNASLEYKRDIMWLINNKLELIKNDTFGLLEIKGYEANLKKILPVISEPALEVYKKG
jgi:hypothetical protein